MHVNAAAVLCSVVSDSFRPRELQPAQAPLSTGFPRQEYWSGLPFPTPEDLPGPGMKSMSLISPALASEFFFFFHHCATWEAHLISMSLSQFIPPSSPHPHSPTGSKSLFSVRMFFFSFLKFTFGRAGFSLLCEGFL